MIEKCHLYFVNLLWAHFLCSWHTLLIFLFGRVEVTVTVKTAATLSPQKAKDAENLSNYILLSILLTAVKYLDAFSAVKMIF